MADTVRTVSVELKMQISDFEAAAAKAGLTVRALGDEVDGLGKKSKTGFDGASKASTDFSRLVTKNLKDGETAFESLTGRSAELRTEITKLRSSFATTGDKSIFGDLKGAESDLKNIESIMGSMGESAGVKAGQDFSMSFGEVLTSPAGIAALAAGVPVITSVVSAAVAGGVGVGLIAGAAVIQRNNPLIQGAFGVLKADAVTTFKGATSGLVGPFADALGYADRLVTHEGPQLRAMFNSVGPAIGLITHGLGGLAEETLPALVKLGNEFSDALKDPAVQSALSSAGGSLVGILNAVAANPQTVRTGIESVATITTAAATIISGTVTVTGAAISGLDKVTGGLKSTGAGNPVQSGSAGLNDKKLEDPFAVKFPWDKQAKAVDTFNSSVQTLTGNLGPFKAETYGAAAAEQLLYQSMTDTFNAAMNLDQANLGAAQGLADLSTAIKTNGKHWDENTQAGRNNMGQLLNSIDADKRAYDAQVAAGGATAGATKKYHDQVDKLLDLARQAGLSKGAIQKLKGEYESIPASRTLTFKVRVVGDLNQAILLGRETGQRIANRYGGVYEHADTGLVRAHIQQATYPAQYAYAEPQTGGEAFIPKLGNYGRSMSILSAAAGWYGARVVPSGGSGSGAGPIQVTVMASPGMPKAIREALMVEIQHSGYGVVKALTPR